MMQRYFKQSWIIATIVLISSAVIFGYLRLLPKDQLQPKPTASKPVTPPPVLLGFQFSPTKNIVTAVNSQVQFQIRANSGNFSITGYDIDLVFPVKSLTAVNCESLLPEIFGLYQTPTQSGLLLSAVKKPTVVDQIIFDQKPIVRCQAKAATEGQIMISYNYIPGSKKESNLIDVNNNDRLNFQDRLIIYSGKPILINRQQKQAMVDGITYNLKLVEEADLRCADCLTEVRLEVNDGKQRQLTRFRIGGYAGYQDTIVKVFNQQLFLNNISKDYVEIIAVKE